MANDRMAIVCKVCNEGISIAKYYPSGGFISGDAAGWGQYPLNPNRVNKFFEKHQHEFDSESSSGRQYFLGYESDDLGWKYYGEEEK